MVGATDESVEIVACGSADKRTIRIPDFVPDDHHFVYFTAASQFELMTAAARWIGGCKESEDG